MSDSTQQQLGNTLWAIADQLRGAMNVDDFRDYMLAFLFLRYLSDNYEIAARKELGSECSARSRIASAKSRVLPWKPPCQEQGIGARSADGDHLATP
ncbi:type I restriction-modification system subunit M N-terminal domain-containing protein [Cyanobium sp. FGCU-6]|nr:type I restriction-modification system subunit M N-terminal domain-containing protein [Cyanobium sp. FGCU6]